MTASLPALRLKPSDENRLRAGHRWVFSNEVGGLFAAGAERAPLKKGTLEAGALIEVVTAQDKPVGVAHYNPATLIAARLLGGSTPPATTGEEPAWIEATLREALAYRRATGCARRGAWRLAFSDSDGLPGLIVDTYGPVAAIQILTAGMDRLRAHVVESLRRLDVGIAHVHEASEGTYRELEGLAVVRTWHTPPPAAPVACTSQVGPVAFRFEVDVEHGQKTGEFLDQAENRAWLLDMLAVGGGADDVEALDLFCYTGHWGVGLAALGARATLVDSSATALEMARRNAALNGVEARCTLHRGDGFQALEEFAAAGRRFGVLVVDPPAFARTKRDVPAALKAYERLNRLALRVAAPGATLVACSCSHHITTEAFGQLLVRAARREGRQAFILAERTQASDHPILLGMDETRYLKAVALRVT